MHAKFPLPDVSWEPTRELWAGAARGELRITRCQSCRRYVWYPETPCRHCGGDALAWTTVSGRGKLFSWSVLRYAWIPQFAEQLPFVTALVALEEDPSVRFVSYVVDCEPARLRCEVPVRAVFRPLRFPGVDGEVVAPMFAPKEATTDGLR